MKMSFFKNKIREQESKRGLVWRVGTSGNGRMWGKFVVE
jgi:hypothetical protein